MAHEPGKWGLFGNGVRTDGPSERPPEPTLRNALIGSARLAVKLAVWVAIAAVAAVAGYLSGGPSWAWYGATGVGVLLLVRVLVEVSLR